MAPNLKMDDELKREGCVLVVDDEAGVRLLAARVIEMLGYQVETAVDGLDGVEKFQEDPERFLLVMLDIMMPRLNGREAFDRIRAVRPEVPVLFTSGFSAAANVVPGPRTDFLPKPFKVDQLRDKLLGLLM